MSHELLLTDSHNPQFTSQQEQHKRCQMLVLVHSAHRTDRVDGMVLIASKQETPPQESRSELPTSNKHLKPSEAKY